ncbi:MAG: DUF6056 family protein [Kofleriaceae bacterium]
MSIAWTVAALFVGALVFCCWREPLGFDAWGHYLYRQQVAVGWSELWGQFSGTYHFGNPRLGQMITVLLYIDEVHRVMTPAMLVFVLLACCYLVRGRWPRLLCGEDWGLVALVTALLLAFVANVGMMWFYRPYAGNYVYGFALYLMLLLPYRRARESSPRRPPAWRAALAALGMLALGFAAGLSNEHTAPAVLVGLVGGWLWRGDAGARAPLAPWMLAGVLGIAAGYAALLLAPGQLIRYGGLAREPLTRWVLERGWGNLKLLGISAAPLAPALVMSVLLCRAPRARRIVTLSLAGALTMSATLLLSPKVGMRLLWPVTVLEVIATAAWFGPALLAPRLHRWTATISAAVILGHAALFVQAYAERGAEQVERLRRLRAATPGTDVALPCYRPRSTHFLVGDDVHYESTRSVWQSRFGVSTHAAGAHCHPADANRRRSANPPASP